VTPPSNAAPSGPLRRQLADRLARARLQQQRGDLHAALRTLTDLLNNARPGERDGATVLSARRLEADTYHRLGHHDHAQQLAAALLADCRQLLPAAHPATVRTASLLAAIAYHRGDLPTAQTFAQWVLTIRPPDTTGAGRPASRAVLLAETHLALIALAQQPTEPTALAHLANVADRWRLLYGPTDPDALRVAAELAVRRHAKGQTETALRLLRRLHADARTGYGTEHHVTRRLDELLERLEPPLPQPPAQAEPQHLPTVPRRTRQPAPFHRHHSHAAARRSRIDRLIWSRRATVGLAVVVAPLFVLLLANQFASNPRLKTTPAPSPAASASGVEVVADLAIRLDASTVVITWTSPATPARAVIVLALSTTSGQLITTVQLPADVNRYTRAGLDPHTDYCATVALFIDTDETSTPGARACTRHPVAAATA
jgi:hypothetical protein